MSDKIQEKVGLTLQSAISKVLKKKLQTELSGTENRPATTRIK